LALTNKADVTLSNIFEPVRQDLEQVELEFSRQVDSHIGLIPEIGRYIQDAGGKRVRPAVLLMAARLSGYTGSLAVLYASAVEFIHTASLVHDDIVDDSTLRRGRQSVHSKWGNDVTVLLGDYLYIKSMSLALAQESLDVLHVLCDVTLRMIEGELFQLSKNGDVAIPEADYFEIVQRKTADLFGGCAEIGGILGKAGNEKRRALREYGFNLGVAFQVVDDLLDLTGREEVLGKPIASDLREGKLTLPVIHLMQHGDNGARAAVTDVVRDRQLTSERWQAISAGLAGCHALDYAYSRATEFGERAKASLASLPGSPERDGLMALPDYVLARDR
jgi:octaprenyl-diphosphate synthase